MKKLVLSSLAALALGAIITPCAHASYIDFDFLDNTISGSGELNVTLNSNGNYTATSGTLAVFGDPSVFELALVANPNGTGIAYAPGIPTYDGFYDDQVMPTATPILDGNGLYFVSGNNDVFLNSTGSPSSDYAYFDYNKQTGTFLSNSNGLTFNVGAVQSGTAPAVPIAVVPEPSTWTAVLSGAGLLGLTLRRRATRV